MGPMTQDGMPSLIRFCYNHNCAKASVVYADRSNRTEVPLEQQKHQNEKNEISMYIITLLWSPDSGSHLHHYGPPHRCQCTADSN